MFIAILTLFLTLCLISNVKKHKVKKAKVRLEGARLNMLLQNIEVYDGSDKGQKRLEDNK